MKCPFCGEEFQIIIEDDEGNIHNEPGYEKDPWSGLCYTIKHPDYYNKCPLTDLYYDDRFDTKEQAELVLREFTRSVMGILPNYKNSLMNIVWFVTSMKDRWN